MIKLERGTIMSYINVGASDRDGKRIKTKKALKESLAQDPMSVLFDGTSNMGPQAFATYGSIAHLPAGDVLSVVGPDPYTKRTWYARVEVINGVVKVS